MIPSHETPDAKNREIEWQLTAPDLNPVRRWLATHRRLEGFMIEPCSTVLIHDVYFDTHDWRVYCSGYALRLRTESGRREVTLKSLRSARNDLADRHELTERLAAVRSSSAAASDPGAPEPAVTSILSLSGEVGAHVRAVAGNAPLRRLFEVSTKRQKFALRDEADGTECEDRRAVAEIAIDEASISRPGSALRTKLERVEVEALAAEISRIEPFVKMLTRQCRLERATQSKFAAGLAACGSTPPPLTGA